METDDRRTPQRGRTDQRGVRRAVVIGASAGGVAALTRTFASMPPVLPAPVFVVLHLPEDGRSTLPEILNRAGPLVAGFAVDGEQALPGRVYVAPPDRHLTLEDGLVRVRRGPKENRHRPAVDPLFRSAALAVGPGALGVMLSGALDDGTAGLLALKSRGGVAIVQDPADASHPGMPLSAIQNVRVDRVLPADEIGPAIHALMSAAPPAAITPVNEQIEYETRVAEGEIAEREDELPGVPSSFSCPDCGGVLWGLHDGDLTRFRCRVGHAYSPQALDVAQTGSIEAALWTALRALREKASLQRHLAERAERRGHGRTAQRFAAAEGEILRQAAMVQDRLDSTAAAEEPADEPDTEAGMGEVSGR